MIRFRNLTLGLVASALLTSTGCSLLHNLKPHRLWRLNRATNGMDSGAYFSVADPIPEPRRETEDSLESAPEEPQTSASDSNTPYVSLRDKRVAVHEKLQDMPFMQSVMMVNSLTGMPDRNWHQ